MKTEISIFPKFFWTTQNITRNFHFLEIGFAILLLSTCAFYLFLLQPLLGQLTNNRIEFERRSNHLSSEKSKPQSQNISQQLENFHNAFGPPSSKGNVMSRVYQAAVEQKLALDQGEYHLERDKYSKLQRYEIELPLKGTYPQLRHFLAKALADVPILALDGVSFNRQKIDDAALDARVKMTLYMREE